MKEALVKLIKGYPEFFIILIAVWSLFLMAVIAGLIEKL